MGGRFVKAGLELRGRDFEAAREIKTIFKRGAAAIPFPVSHFGFHQSPSWIYFIARFEPGPRTKLTPFPSFAGVGGGGMRENARRIELLPCFVIVRG